MAKDRTRVLLVNDHLGWGGQVHGVARLFRLWANHLDADKYDVTVCILNKKDGLSSVLEDDGIKTIFLGKAKYDPFTLLDLVRLIRREKIDVLHLQAYRSTTFGRLAGLITGVPVVVHFHDTSPYYPLVQRLSDRLTKGMTDVYLAVSNSARRLWASRYNLDDARITVMQNCTSLREFASPTPLEIEAEKSRLGIAPDYKVVGTVTALFPRKGTRYFLEAAPTVLEKFPKTKFVIVGDGPLRAELEELASELGLDEHVVFVGYAENVAPILGTFDVNVLSSIAAEGLPLTILEAMAMGKSIVVTDIIEVIEDGVNGLVVPIENAAALAEKITCLLGDEAEAKRLGSNAKESAVKYDVKTYVQELGRVYDSLVAR